jgi:hypothetical protein
MHVRTSSTLSYDDNHRHTPCRRCQLVGRIRAALFSESILLQSLHVSGPAFLRGATTKTNAFCGLSLYPVSNQIFQLRAWPDLKVVAKKQNHVTCKMAVVSSSKTSVQEHARVSSPQD